MSPEPSEPDIGPSPGVVEEEDPDIGAAIGNEHLPHPREAEEPSWYVHLEDWLDPSEWVDITDYVLNIETTTGRTTPPEAPR